MADSARLGLFEKSESLRGYGDAEPRLRVKHGNIS
jgi:hypothetical protein